MIFISISTRDAISSKDTATSRHARLLAGSSDMSHSASDGLLITECALLLDRSVEDVRINLQRFREAYDGNWRFVGVLNGSPCYWPTLATWEALPGQSFKSYSALSRAAICSTISRRSASSSDPSCKTATFQLSPS